MPKKSEDKVRLVSERILWLVTSGKSQPHLAPVWHIIHDGSIYVCTGLNSKKGRNISYNPQVSFSLQDGVNPLIGEGKAVIIKENYPEAVISAFKEKYDWNIRNDKTYDCLVKITPQKWLLGK